MAPWLVNKVRINREDFWCRKSKFFTSRTTASELTAHNRASFLKAFLQHRFANELQDPKSAQLRIEQMNRE
jgi:hypothetical protein